MMMVMTEQKGEKKTLRKENKRRNGEVLYVKKGKAEKKTKK